ncbi:MAG: hypothetical protein K6G60_02840 [Lachnospiraceae bacterium]|nr:hypothetical protein [Lachnospiraceae bacterium]
MYELAKWIGKRMKNNEENGHGNEFESLKYVLEEYVPVEDLLQGFGNTKHRKGTEICGKVDRTVGRTPAHQKGL